MNIYIQREGEFYDFSGKEFGSMAMYAGGLCFDEKYITKERDFPIGSRVFIENVGWTEIKEGHCDDCSLSEIGTCNDSRLSCGSSRGDGKYVVFAKINPAQTVIDYRALLKKYMKHVFHEEGTNFLYSSMDGVSPHDFSELEKIYEEAFAEFKEESK